MSEMKVDINKEKFEIRMERVFDTTREKLWAAHTDPKAIEQWWGPRKYKTVVEVLEPRVGGKWRFTNEAEGEKHVFYGEFKELIEPEKITWTFTYEPYPDSASEETVTFTELPDGKTKVSAVSDYPSLEALEGMIQGGMEEGARETWDRLAEQVEKKGAGHV